MKGPRHLWTGDWRSDSQENADTLAEHERLRPPPEDPLAEPTPQRAAASSSDRDGSAAATTERRSRLRTAPFAIGLAIAILAAAGIFASSLIGGSGKSDKQNANSANALPSVGAKPLTPRKGQTVAGAVYDAASPAVVSIRTSEGSGTGFLVDKRGILVTNDHVVGNSKTVTVRFGRDGGSLVGDVLGTDPSSDLAVVSIPKGSLPSNAKPLQFADSRNARVGDTVIAIGNPFDLDRTATEGIVSALGRDITSPNNYTINNVIQTDAPINPGNSGGPLLDVSAHVIGVNSQIATAGSQGNVGIGFAVPANTVRQVVPILEKGGTIKRAYLGVSTQSPNPTGTGHGASGAQVASVVSGGPANRAGLQVGDVIKSVAGKRVADPTQLSTIVSAKAPGDRVPVVVERHGTTVTIPVTLGTRPASTSSP